MIGLELKILDDVIFCSPRSFYRKRFYTRHLLKQHNIGTAGAGSEPDSPTAPHPPSAIGASQPVVVSPAPSAQFPPHSQQQQQQQHHNTTITAMPRHSSSAQPPPTTTAATVVVQPPTAQRPVQIIRRVVTTSGNQPTTTAAAAAAQKIPMIVSIQSIAKPQRTFASYSTATSPSSAVQRANTAQLTTRAVANDNGGNGIDEKPAMNDTAAIEMADDDDGGGGGQAEPEEDEGEELTDDEGVRYEIADSKDDLLIMGS